MRTERRPVRAARWCFLPAILALAAAGCGKEYVYFRPAENPQGASPGWVAQGKYRIPPTEGAVEVALSARGTVETDKGHAERSSLEVKFDVRNRGASAWSLDAAAAKIIDDDGRQVAGARAYSGKTQTGQIAIAGGARETFYLTFDLPENVQFESLGSLRVIWPYRYGEAAFEGQTKFIRIEEVTYYYPDYPGYYYGPYYGYYPLPPYYGPRYYDPWYYDPWWGPPGYRHFHRR
jgi:hypothetical protein